MNGGNLKLIGRRDLNGSSNDHSHEPLSNFKRSQMLRFNAIKLWAPTHSPSGARCCKDPASSPSSRAPSPPAPHLEALSLALPTDSSCCCRRWSSSVAHATVDSDVSQFPMDAQILAIRKRGIPSRKSGMAIFSPPSS